MRINNLLTIMDILKYCDAFLMNHKCINNISIDCIKNYIYLSFEIIESEYIIDILSNEDDVMKLIEFISNNISITVLLRYDIKFTEIRSKNREVFLKKNYRHDKERL